MSYFMGFPLFGGIIAIGHMILIGISDSLIYVIGNSNAREKYL